MACAGQAPAPPRATPPCTSPADLSWLETTREIRITEVSTGHFGALEFLADLVRHQGEEEFVGVIMGTYRRGYGLPTHTASREVRIRASDVIAMLATFRSAAQLAPSPPDARHGFIEDSSRTDALSLVAIARVDAGPGMRVAPHHVEFFVDDGQQTPQTWRRRGYEAAFSYEAGKRLTQVFSAFLATAGRDALFEPLRVSAQSDRMP